MEPSEQKQKAKKRLAQRSRSRDVKAEYRWKELEAMSGGKELVYALPGSEKASVEFLLLI